MVSPSVVGLESNCGNENESPGIPWRPTCVGKPPREHEQELRRAAVRRAAQRSAAPRSRPPAPHKQGPSLTLSRPAPAPTGALPPLRRARRPLCSCPPCRSRTRMPSTASRARSITSSCVPAAPARPPPARRDWRSARPRAAAWQARPPAAAARAASVLPVYIPRSPTHCCADIAECAPPPQPPARTGGAASGEQVGDAVLDRLQESAQRAL